MESYLSLKVHDRLEWPKREKAFIIKLTRNIEPGPARRSSNVFLMQSLKTGPIVMCTLLKGF